MSRPATDYRPVPEGQPVCGQLHDSILDIACNRAPHSSEHRHRYVSDSGRLYLWIGDGRLTQVRNIAGGLEPVAQPDRS